MRFDAPVVRNGYRWWYADALSDDGENALIVIAFVGSAFSPYYRRARWLERGDPDNHCALNVALYGPRADRWAMTERGRSGVSRTPASIRIGPSSLDWDGDALTIEVDEICVPVPRRLKGRIVVEPLADCGAEFFLNPSGSHRWRPIAPMCRVTVELDRPDSRWQGHGYLDSNCGDAPLENDFLDWNWSRTHSGDFVRIRYNVRHKNGARDSLELQFDKEGRHVCGFPAPVLGLPRSPIWRMYRETTSDRPIRVVRTLEDTPFYTRSILAETMPAGGSLAVHECLSLQRLAYPLVQAMLPFRMPRRRR